MDSADYEAVIAEYAEIEKQLSSWAVFRRRRFARRLRRQQEAMEAIVFDGSANRWDPYDPYDALITVRQIPRPDGEPIAPDTVIESCLRHATRLGWETEFLELGSALAVYAGKNGPGAWSVFKWLSGVHEFVDPPNPFIALPGPPGAPVRVEVRVWPDDAGPTEPSGPQEDWREEVYRRQGPSCWGDPSAIVRITHVPSGRQAKGCDHGGSGNVSVARANAWRLMRAMLLADDIGPDEPAYLFVRPAADPVGRYPLWGASSFDVEAVAAEARRRARPPADDLTGGRTPPR